ncbi:hypothetical protein FCH28_09650 [Streptomyces piniterrae]|uniref:Uncharacterized protein n=1 Tax=Streptomyces piniterrae TaxID=2571125 RepID=A0A4U0NMI4_9ACTN|nr:hypothetical protein [Streptomyces piniterrae]TJZ55595.1 hypothetical protein FCH28_09650 [Streptomyces piniterrae]
MARVSIRNFRQEAFSAAVRQVAREYRERKEAEAREAEAREQAEAAATLRKSAEAREEAARESVEASDTDGFRSQWAHGLCAREDRLAARIAEDGGVAEFPGLFDLDGNLVPARRVQGQYGWSWELLRQGRRAGWFNESKAKNAETRRRNNAAKGFYVGTVRAPAEATMQESEGRTVAVVAERTDGGWSPDVEIVDSGQ